ncbi:hypothetical protein A4G20_02185 [Pasteurellaceae bacterium RH1A]|nr:hypothetical protein A4G20_02185 [Pasteurellaceae bacterium RH1A]
MGYFEQIIGANLPPAGLQKYLYQELVRITTLLDESVSPPQIFGQMAALVKKARYEVNAESDSERLDQLLHLVYQDWHFGCHAAGYFHSDNLMLNKVLRTRCGMPVSLGAVVLNLAASLNLPLYPVNFPTQLILRAELQEGAAKVVKYINPWDGSFLDYAQLNKLLEGEMGYASELKSEYLRRADVEELQERLETVVKMTLAGEGRYEDALKLIEFRLILNPDDPYQIRDRGMMLAGLHCYHAAVEDLTYFIDQCPDDPSAMMLKLEMPALVQQSKQQALH